MLFKRTFLIFAVLALTLSLVSAKLTPPIAKRVMDAVVRIDIKSKNTLPNSLQGELEKNSTYGSGFIFRPNGYIATNLHILGDDGASIQGIEVTFANGLQKPAKIVGYDRFLDILVLKVEDTGLPVITFGDSSKVPVTTTVYVFGHPLSLSHSIVKCFISAMGRDIYSNEGITASRSFPAGITRNLIQLDGSLNPGLSGGPVTNEFGHVIGIASSNFGNDTHSVGVGFCLPINSVTASLKTIRESGKPIFRGTLGVHSQPLDEPTIKKQELKKLSGVLVTSVDANSPAEVAEFRVGDILLSINGHAIKTPTHLLYIVKSAPVGTKLPATIFRQGQIIKKTVVLTPDTRDALPISSDLFKTPTSPSTSLGFSFRDDTSNTALVIKSFTPNALNRHLSLNDGDIIHSLNNAPVQTPKDFDCILDRLSKTQSTVILSIVRDGQQILETLKIR